MDVSVSLKYYGNQTECWRQKLQSLGKTVIKNKLYQQSLCYENQAIIILTSFDDTAFQFFNPKGHKL